MIETIAGDAFRQREELDRRVENRGYHGSHPSQSNRRSSFHIYLIAGCAGGLVQAVAHIVTYGKNFDQTDGVNQQKESG
jgi:hypothetical protein